MMSLVADTMAMVSALRVGTSCCGLPACRFTKNHVTISKQLRVSDVRGKAINNNTSNSSRININPIKPTLSDLIHTFRRLIS